MPDATRLVLVWQRNGATAGHAVWVWQDRIYAATLYLSGLSDADDNTAVANIQNMYGVNAPREYIENVRSLERPLVATLYLGNEAVTKTPITAAAAGLGQTLFRQVNAVGTHPPLGNAPPPTPPRQFYQLLVKSGKVVATMWPSLDLLAQNPDVEEVVGTFKDRLNESPDAFQSRLRFRRAPEVRLQWQAFHPTAGVADLTYEGQQLSQTLLLLSGKDEAADEAAVNAFEQTLKAQGETPDLPNTFTQIRTAPRPLLVSFGARSLEETDLVVNMIEWGLAAAYFQRTGAL